MEFRHVSVLLDECMEYLAPERGGVYVDCTAGGGGHSLEIAKRLPAGSRLICLDRDDEAIEACRARLDEYGDRCVVYKSNFSDIGAALDALGVDRIDGALWDLGVSSHQLDDASRGFSYMSDAPLDMRMDKSSPVGAFEVVNGYAEEELARIISDYGEEKFASRIAKNIAEARRIKKIETTAELCDLIIRSIPAGARRREAQHPAKRTFQAIRIEVNSELAAIAPSIETAIDRMNVGGRAAVITFHSGEDRIVKQTFARLADPCECPKSFPVCVCGKKPKVKLINKKPVLPSAKEQSNNPRSRSAKLRVAEKIAPE
ncbi:MAG: 16S rRNA (cytosine(1402)-N(4))-methyltransferase RsmH [Clostridia bacterium]|nr:16S rRNA (cytosine(1402)-N(4))-methyltransferase RsmH [Clostridia bacterium]